MNTISTKCLSEAFKGEIIPENIYSKDLQDLLGINDIGLIKGCTAEIILGGYQKQDIFQRPNRGKVTFMLALDFAEAGVEKQKTLEVLFDWNLKLPEPRSKHEVKSDIERAYKNQEKYRFGCNHPIRRHFCINKNFCQYMKKSSKNSPIRGTGASTFLYYWVLYLPSASLRAGFTICFLEKIKRLKPGDVLFTSFKEISYRGNISLSSVNRALTILKNRGILELYEKGEQHKWDKIGNPKIKPTKVKRKIPIPRPYYQKGGEKHGQI